MNDVDAIIARACRRLERRRLDGESGTEGWVPLVQQTARGAVRVRGKQPGPPPKAINRPPLPAGSSVSADILASLISPMTL